MANEEQLRANWDETFHNSSEYQRAKQEDAYAMTRRERSARDEMQTALLRGDTRRASSIQQQLQREKSRPGVNSQAADNYQKQRVTDFIDQAQRHGQERANEIRSGPLSGVSYSGNYLQGLENPDFANYFPTSHLGMRFKVGDSQPTPPRPTGAAKPVGVPKAPTKPAKSGVVAPRPDPTGLLDFARRGGAARQNESLIHEREFNRNLPPELRGSMANYMAQATAAEKNDFLSHPAEWRYGRLREQQYRDSKIPTATPPPMGSASKPSQPLFTGTIKAPGANPGLGLGQSPYTPANTMPVTAPVLSSKPVNALAQPSTPTMPKAAPSMFEDVLDEDDNPDETDNP